MPYANEDTASVELIRNVVLKMRRSGLSALDYEDCQVRLFLQLQEDAVSSYTNAMLPAKPVQAVHTPVLSPEMGTATFRHAPAQTIELGVDDHVDAEQILAFLEVGVIILPVVSPVAGRIAEIRMSEGDIVGYHDVLFSIRPT